MLLNNEKLIDYYDALERIINGRVQRVKSNEKISLRSVAIEAGKTSGAIKKSRPLYHQLINDINSAAKQMKKTKSTDELALEKAKQTANKYKALYEASLAREVVLMSKLLNK